MDFTKFESNCVKFGKALPLISSGSLQVQKDIRSEQKFGSNKIFGLKKMLVQNNCVSIKRFWVQKKSEKTNLRSKKMLVQNNCVSVKKILSSKKSFWSEKSFRSEKNFGPKKIFVPKLFRAKKICIQNNFVSKMIWGPN